MLRPILGAGLILAFNVHAYTEGDVPAAKLLQAVKEHAKLFPETLNKFQSDMENPKNISMYGMTNATTWTSDMDVDCDGTATTNCNKQRDSYFQNQLSIGVNLSAEAVPYFVIPIGSPSNSSQRGIVYGQIGAVIYNDQVVFAVFVDECGVNSLIGEASYATNKLLGVDPDPATGGTDGPVTFIVFTGVTGRITDKSKYTSHDAAIAIGNARAKQLMTDYNIDWQTSSGALRPGAGGNGLGSGEVTGSYRLAGRTLRVKTAAEHLVSLSDAQGHKVFTAAGRGEGSYDMKGLKPGVYLVTVTGSGSTHAGKVAVF